MSAPTNQVIDPSAPAAAPAAAAAEAPKKTRVMIGLPGDSFSQAFLISWTQALHVLIASNRYELIVCPGKSSFVTFARMQTLGLDVRRGKNQKPFNGADYDVYVTIDSDVVFSASQLIELIECTKLHPVVSGTYMMADQQHLAVVRDWSREYFKKNGTFEFLKPSDFEADMKEFMEELESRKKLEEEKKELPAISQPKFMKVSYAGMGFFACRKEVLDSMEYPYFNHELQRIRGDDGIEMVDQCSEDVAFCLNIAKSGFDVMVNTRLRVGHNKSIII
jgi:hypothetical protein